MSEALFFRTGDGCRIAYRFDGRADKPVLLLSNSLGTTMGMWDAQVAALSDHFRILRYDSRGHGMSDAPPGAYSMDRLGRDVIELMDALALSRIHFCGLSKGGMVGQWLGVYAPERIAQLILCNTSSYMGPPLSWDTRIETVRTEGMTAVAQAVVTRWFTAAFQAAVPTEVERIKAMLLQTNQQGYAGCCAAIRDMDMRKLAPLIALPVLIIAGDDDPATPLEHSKQLASAIAGAQLKILQAAHLSNVEQPEAFTQALLAFAA
jgi:3-oxoadipate enol-lactonase